MVQNQEISSTPLRSWLEQLPLEAKQAILSSLTDIASLKATALTCSSFYYALKNAEQLIITEVLFNEIDIDVLPEAIVAGKVKTWTRTAVFAANIFQSRQPISPKKRWEISELLPLSKIAKHINFFAADLAEKALASMPPVSLPPSREELNRIKRALYRFEIYCNLFRSLGSSTQVLQPRLHGPRANAFFGCFSAWENEQLTCVYDYLFSAVAPGIFFLPYPFIPLKLHIF